MYTTQVMIEGIARALRQHGEHGAPGDLVQDIADAIAEAKPRFDRERFIADTQGVGDALAAKRAEQTTYLVVETSGNGEEIKRMIQQHGTAQVVTEVEEDAAFAALGS